MLKYLKIYVFWLFVFVGVYSAFNCNSARNVNEIAPEVLKSPVVTEIVQQSPKEFISYGYRYSLMPVYQCEMSGLIVDKQMTGLVTFRMFEDRLAMNKIFTVMWAGNVRNRTYQNANISFFAGSVNWQGVVKVNYDEFARLALITRDRAVWVRIKSLCRGDQIIVTGKLVNLTADRITPAYCGNHFEMKTGSPGHNDLNWIMYVEDLRILKKANLIFKVLFWISIFGLAALTILHFLGK